MKQSQIALIKYWRKVQARFLVAVLLLLSLAALLLAGRGVWILLQEEESKLSEELEVVFEGSSMEQGLLKTLVNSASTKEDLIDSFQQLGLWTKLNPKKQGFSIYCQYPRAVAYCSQSKELGLTAKGSLVYVEPVKRSQNLPFVILPSKDSSLEYYRSLQPLLLQLLDQADQLQKIAPSWQVLKMDLSEYEGEGRAFSTAGIDGGTYFGDIVMHMQHRFSPKGLNIYFRMGYGACLENCQRLTKDLLFEELLSEVHPIWENHSALLFDLRFAGSIYYKAL